MITTALIAPYEWAYKLAIIVQQASLVCFHVRGWDHTISDFQPSRVLPSTAKQSRRVV